MHRHITLGPGWIRVGPRPRGGDWLEIDIANLRSESFSFVVSMLTDAENQELGLEHEKAVCDELKIDFYSFPILDRSIPGDRREFGAFANRLLRRTKAGEAGFLHCRAGLGRAPLLACIMMLLDGIPPGKAWSIIAKHRDLPVPDTPTQKAWPRATTGALTLADAFTKPQSGSEA